MTFPQNQLIALATSLDKSEKEVQIYYLHSKSFHTVRVRAGVHCESQCSGTREGIIAGKSGGIISRYASHC